MTSYATRLASFTSWPHTCPSASAVASAGFHQEHDPSFPVPDLAVCSLCGLDPFEWKNEPDDPFDFHATRSPKCPFVRATQQKKRNKKTRQQYKRREKTAEKTQHATSSKATTVNTSLRSTVLQQATKQMCREANFRLSSTPLIASLASLRQQAWSPPYIRFAKDLEATGQG